MAVYASNDIVSNEICRSGTWELLRDAGQLEPFGKPGTALDIGGNVGYMTFVMAQAGWRVITFEPNPANVAMMSATLCRNPHLAPKVTVHAIGLGASQDRCELISSTTNIGDTVTRCGAERGQPLDRGIFKDPVYEKRGEFDVRRLDDVLKEENLTNINFVKIDVEGYECQVLKGGPSLLSQYRPKLIESEVWSTLAGCSVQEYFDLFTHANYAVGHDAQCQTTARPPSHGIVNVYMCARGTPAGSLLSRRQGLRLRSGA